MSKPTVLRMRVCVGSEGDGRAVFMSDSDSYLMALYDTWLLPVENGRMCSRGVVSEGLMEELRNEIFVYKPEMTRAKYLVEKLWDVAADIGGIEEGDRLFEPFIKALQEKAKHE